MSIVDPAFKTKVYVETSVISYLAARPSKDPVVYAHQLVTTEWWHGASASYDLCTSALVYDEARQGSPSMAAKRVSFLDQLRS